MGSAAFQVNSKAEAIENGFVITKSAPPPHSEWKQWVCWQWRCSRAECLHFQSGKEVLETL